MQFYYSRETMPKGYVEVSIRADVDSGGLLGMLQDSEALGCWEDKGIIRIYWPEEKWTPKILADLREASASLAAEDREPSPEIRIIPDTDWNATWAASLIPIRLGRRVRIRQSWHAVDPDFDGIELVIDPKRAFGTGYHATTQLVIAWLEEHIHGGERLMDIGTGTGILAMVALRLGAESALAIDKDPVALECAKEYAAVNGFGRELELRAIPFQNLSAGSFDVIVANLNRKTIPELCVVLSGMLKAGGVTCLSGLQSQDYDEIAAALRNGQLQINTRMDREDWLALEVSRET
jgi:ribosomal protein L11 methyltransferase